MPVGWCALAEPRRGQLFFLDGVFAGAIIVAVLLSLYAAEEYVSSSSLLDARSTDLGMRTAQAASLLVETPGSPSNWSGLAASAPETIASLGLTTGIPLVIDHGKIAAFASLLDEDSARTAAIAGFQGPGYGLRLRLLSVGEDETLFSAGDAPGEGAGDIVRIVRYGLYNGSRAAIEITGWQP